MFQEDMKNAYRIMLDSIRTFIISSDIGLASSALWRRVLSLSCLP